VGAKLETGGWEVGRLPVSGTQVVGAGPLVGGLVFGPVHVTPLRANDVGTGLLPFHDPLNPKLVLPPLGMAPL